MKRRIILSLSFAAAAALTLAAACGPAGFESEDIIDSVRVLATRADNGEAYAKPGDVVTLETLMVDGRANKSPPAVTYWIPFLCENPIDDAYYGCFAPLLGEDAGGTSLPSAPDAGADDAGEAGAASDAGAAPVLSPVISPGAFAGLFTAGVDITPYLPTGPFTFRVPADAITSHTPPKPGNPAYGLVIVFNIACAGRVKTLPIDPSAGPQQVPIGCFDTSGNALGPDDYVIGFTRVYVSARRDPNPIINGFIFNGTESFVPDAGGGIPGPISVRMPPCPGGGCAGVNIDTDVAQSSYLAGNSEDGGPAPKSIWVDYYAMGGSLGDEARLLYDQGAGKVTNTVDPVTFSDDAGVSATLWAVVHDTYGGVTWLQVNVAP